MHCTRDLSTSAQDDAGVVVWHIIYRTMRGSHITTVCVVDLDSDYEAKHSLKVCGKSCILREQENPYGATRLPEKAFLFSFIHGSLEFQDSSVHFHGQTCSICLNTFKKHSDDIIKICCGHGFHSRCLIPWFSKVGTCPVCC
ncbi:hypothetical protein MKW98_016262 [Papaver atlanticum]|uniref:RING-type domain-containing protein n=1 Tax=Papaver atlanticum TaxID=357466 RepID=A0AAD4SGW5_9MAGN|nr:hypothetical protein MKW98_016262 [Papaver atlanticum]